MPSHQGELTATPVPTHQDPEKCRAVYLQGPSRLVCVDYIDFTDASGNLLTAGGPAVKLARVPKASAMALQSIVRAALQSA